MMAMGDVLQPNLIAPIQWRIVIPMAIVAMVLVVVGCVCVGAVDDVETLGWLLRAKMVALGIGLVAFLALTSRPRGSEGEAGEPVRRRIAELEATVAQRTHMLQEAYLDMKSLELVKETFLSNMSHEMRTPLTSIMAAEEILSSYADETPETREEFLNIIRQESGRLLELICKLLDLAKLEANALRLHYEPVDICELVEESVGSILSQRPEFANSVDVTMPIDSVVCQCDRDRIARVLHSMLENALRYSPDCGGVQVTVALATGRISIAVEDEGERTAERFNDMFEGECVDRRSTAGSPFVGYPIAERLAGMHGGTLTPEQSDSGGTVVTLLLPMGPTQARAPTEAVRVQKLALQGS
jgi:K+-sensing histidine kinase KdpD